MGRGAREIGIPLAALLPCLGMALTANACGDDAPAAGPNSKGGSAPSSDGSGASSPIAGQSHRAGTGGIVTMGGSPAGGAADAGASNGGAAADTSGGSGGETAGGAAGGDGGTGPSQGATSCQNAGPGLSNCGQAKDESCCISLPVPGGTFSRSYRNTGSGATGEADPATISAYALDKYEVTVARFREYVKYLENGGKPPAAGSGKHTHLNAGQGLADSGKPGSFEKGWDAAWNSKIPSGAGATAKWKSRLRSPNNGAGGCDIYGSWTDEPGKNDLLPITCTSWYESYAFCIWDGGFLPTEAEWKYAAAGGDEQRQYPWGTTAPGSMNEYAIYDCCYPSGPCSAASGRDTCTGVVNIAPVGFAKKGVGRYGQVDLVGSVWEWLVDRYSSYKSPCEDCAYLSGSTSNRVMPGAGFHTGASLGATLLYSWNRSSISYDAETYRGDYAVGVRCGRAP